jgi:hypothetical protein
MRTFVKLFLILSFGSMLILAGGAENPHVLIKTELGDIMVEIFEKEAPITANTFLKYVDAGLLNDATFYRIVTMDNQPDNDIKIEVIQGGLGYTEGRKTYPLSNTKLRKRPGFAMKTASSPWQDCSREQPLRNFSSVSATSLSWILGANAIRTDRDLRPSGKWSEGGTWSKRSTSNPQKPRCSIPK